MEATERVLENSVVGSVGHFSIGFIAASGQSSFMGGIGARR
ncbi:hypothetical protein OOZ15_12325 [Galbibacter sp. EGI 63066]|nr:hypothetical protein [Galbibacter sp. EGI 63066]MCX2680730.1 hypothetical protein [Galbibacter sp. EGI 63066]